MIKDKTIDEALIEIMRTKKALEALRKAIKSADAVYDADRKAGERFPRYTNIVKEHAVAKRASLDLTHKLADLRQGR